MTGFARVDGAENGRRWTWEAKSVNGRGLEVRFRLPPGHDYLEPDLRKFASEAFARGTLSATLTLDRTASGAVLRINEAALDEALKAVASIRARIDCEKPRAEGVLNIRGVLVEDEGDADDEARAHFAAALIASFRDVAAALKKARDGEGKALAAGLSHQIDEVERLASEARAHAAAVPGAIRQRIAAQLSELLAGGGLSEERVAQEAALLAIKADIREELDRLVAHVAAARALLKDKEPVGRRLDFLTQEFNREANTLCSKAQDMGLKRLGLDLKTVIDQMREQVQNIE
ncbi:MAG TPA: YicC/YloC family endoribonuclease [Parvularculaceae bacterium]|nr:YicC/YloC family endoribonuclease [Parvularculaceae bacterium]